MKTTWKSPVVGSILIILLTVVAYLPVMHGGFIWDDDFWTTRISVLLRDVSGLRLMWCQSTALQQYYPLSGTTFWLDYHLWGFRTLPYHVENVLLHAASAVLFWQLLRRLETPGAWLAGAIFALHPVMVESAGWITERKNVLSLVFYLGALLAYGRFHSFWKEDNGAPARRWGAYGLAVLLCLGALLAKTTAFSLPAVIVLIGWWKRGRVRWREDVVPTLPMFAMAIGLCLLTGWLEKTHVGAQGADFALTFPQRCLIAGRAPWFYVGKLLWPVNLCFVYPRWQPDTGSWQQWLYPAAAVGVLVALWLARRRMGRGPAAAAFFFVGTLFPLLGFFNAYGMRYSFVWNHWVYLPSLGLITLAAALAARAAVVLRAPRGFNGVATGVLVALGALTWKQALIYQDMETLWVDTLTRNPQCWMAHNNLGLALESLGRTQEATQHFEQALQIKPDYVEAHNNLGIALLQTGKVKKAMEQAEQALRIESNSPVAHNNLGLILAEQGRLPEAIGHYEQALRSQPDFAAAHYNLGIALNRAGKVQEAVEHLNKAVRLTPNNADFHYDLGDALIRQGKVTDALAQYEQASQIAPNNAAIHRKLGAVLIVAGKPQEAVGHLERALRVKPDFAEAQNDLAWALGTLPKAEGGDAVRAVSLAQRACELTGNRSAAYLDTLAVAYGAAGRFSEAVASAQKAIELARSAGQAALVKEIEARLELYRNGRAYTQPTRATNPSNP